MSPSQRRGHVPPSRPPPPARDPAAPSTEPQDASGLRRHRVAAPDTAPSLRRGHVRGGRGSRPATDTAPSQRKGHVSKCQVARRRVAAPGTRLGACSSAGPPSSSASASSSSSAGPSMLVAGVVAAVRLPDAALELVRRSRAPSPTARGRSSPATSARRPRGRSPSSSAFAARATSGCASGCGGGSRRGRHAVPSARAGELRAGGGILYGTVESPLDLQHAKALHRRRPRRRPRVAAARS